jgi:ElaB/YqjD/DUF883 family membrane-anchored ribosome-binding protein
MNTEKNSYESPKQQLAEESGRSVGAMAEGVLERGAEVYDQAEKAGSDAYDKTAQAVNKTYDEVKRYSSENPGQTILIALGIGFGLGFILGASSGRSRTGRFAQPVVNALSDLALEIFH